MSASGSRFKISGLDFGFRLKKPETFISALRECHRFCYLGSGRLKVVPVSLLPYTNYVYYTTLYYTMLSFLADGMGRSGANEGFRK